MIRMRLSTYLVQSSGCGEVSLPRIAHSGLWVVSIASSDKAVNWFHWVKLDCIESRNIVYVVRDLFMYSWGKHVLEVNRLERSFQHLLSWRKVEVFPRISSLARHGQ